MRTIHFLTAAALIHVLAGTLRASAGEPLLVPVSIGAQESRVAVFLRNQETSGSCPRAYVLLPGLGSNHWTMERIAEEIPAPNLVVSLDYLGYGESAKLKVKRVPNGFYSLESDALVLLQVLRDVLPECGPISLLGHSYGAAVAFEALINDSQKEGFSQQLDRIDSLVLVSTPTPWMTEIPPAIADLESRSCFEIKLGAIFGKIRERVVMKLLETSYSRIEVAEEVFLLTRSELTHCRRHRATLKRIRSLRRRLEPEQSKAMRSALRGLTIPTLVIAGTTDRITPAALQKNLVSQLPLAEYRPLCGAHGIQYEYAARIVGESYIFTSAILAEFPRLQPPKNEDVGQHSDRNARSLDPQE